MAKYLVGGPTSTPYQASVLLNSQPSFTHGATCRSYLAGKGFTTGWGGNMDIIFVPLDSVEVGKISNILTIGGRERYPYTSCAMAAQAPVNAHLFRRRVFTSSGDSGEDLLTNPAIPIGTSTSIPYSIRTNFSIIIYDNKYTCFQPQLTHIYTYTHSFGVATEYVAADEVGLESEMSAATGNSVTYVGMYYVLPGLSHWFDLGSYVVIDSLPDISKFWITPTGAYMKPGESLTFTAHFETQPDYEWGYSFRWSLEGIDASEGSISFPSTVRLSDTVSVNSFNVKCIINPFSVSTQTTVYIGSEPPDGGQVDNPYDPGGNSGPAGGGGGFGNDRENDDITQLIPPGSAANSLTDAGIFSHYLVNSAQLKDFSRWLFSDNFLEVLGKELIELWWGDTFGAIISLMSYPFAVGKLPMITSKPSNIYLGHFDTKAGSSGLLTSESSQLDWGNIDITEYWGNFLDYAPHTKIQLYLPWGTGFVDIDPNECMNGSLNVKTNIELAKGNCVHIVSNSSGAVIGTYNGFCGAQYPITSKDTSGKAIGTVISAVSAAVAIGSAAVTGGASIAGNVATQAASAAAELGLSGTVGKEFKAEAEAAFAKADKFRKVTSTAAKTAAVSSIAAARTPVNYVRSGSFSPNAGHLAVQVPYIIMTWPDQSVPEQYGNFVGYPSNIFARLGSLNGYTEVGAIHLDYINCTEHEREELLRILQGGVIL